MYWGNQQYSPFAATCTRTTANVGDIITIRASGTGGTPNYTAYFSQTGGLGSLSAASVANLGEGVQGTVTYTVQAGDSGNSITFSAYVMDSCPSGAKTSTSFSCPVSITVACGTPSCNFSVT